MRELNRLGGEHGVGRSDVVEDRLFGIKSREFYEAPTPTILLTAHRDLQSLVHSREMISQREIAEPALRGAGLHGHVVPRPAAGPARLLQRDAAAASPARSG